MNDEKNAVKMRVHDRILTTSYRDDFRSHEILYDEFFRFEKGKSYGILCEAAEGGGGISWLLSGRDEVKGEDVIVFGKKYCDGERIEEGWFVSEGIPGVNEPVYKEIKIALKQSGANFSMEDIVHEFGLSEDRLGYKIGNYSWEAWRASVAIGYAMGKQIFCFPWLYSSRLLDLVLNTAYFFYVDKLKENGSIVILPSGNREILEDITDEIVELNNPRFKDLSRFNEYIDDYKEKRLWFQK